MKGNIKMAENNIKIRTATVDDARKLLDIYRYYVEGTAVTFEYNVPTVKEFSDRILNTLKKYPYLAAEIDGEVLGYAYGGSFHEREAYKRCAETSIYVRHDARRSGIGRALYGVLENILREMGVLNLYACIGFPENEDKYLTYDSAEFHKRLGFSVIGEFHKCGFKFGNWYNMIWAEKMIGDHTCEPKSMILFPELDREIVCSYLQNL